MLPFSSAIPSIFWLIAEFLIAMGLSEFLRKTWSRELRGSKAVIVATFCFGILLVFAGPSLFSELGTPPFGRRLVWNLLCVTWAILEWVILILLIRILSESKSFIFGARNNEIQGNLLFWFGLGVILLATMLFHVLYLAPEIDPQQIRYKAYLFVRLVGCGYVVIEGAIALTLFFCWKRTKMILSTVSQP